MFLERSRGVFILRLFWRSVLRLSHFLRKQGLWKSTVHPPLLNHPVGSGAGAAGPEWGSATSRIQRPVEAWPGYRRWPGPEGRLLGKGMPWPAHTICFSALGLWPGTAGEEREYLSLSAERIPLGAPSGCRQCGSPG